MKRRHFLTLAGSSAVLGVGSPNFAESSESGIREPERVLPIAHDADVVVCGGGPAGVAAALAAARKGVKTVLLESGSCLGGIWTAGALCLLLDHANKPGIMAEILERLQKQNGLPDSRKNSGTCYEVEAMKFLLEQMCIEAGVTVQLFTQVADAVTCNGRMRAVITESKSGREAVTGRIFIDCTGDGDVAARAGCGFDFGRPDDGSFMPMSLMALLTGLDAEEMKPFIHKPQALLAEMRRCGVEPSYRRPSLWYLNDHLFGWMTTHAHGLRGYDVRELTRAQMTTRAELNAIVSQLRASGGVWKNLCLAATAEKIGVREGRRIHGQYTVTEQDLREGRKHDDAVCRVTYCVDVHAPKPLDPGQSSIAESWRVKPYDIPLRALIAKDVEGLLLAGRCISGDFLAHSSYRVTGNAVPMGEAAGNYAANRIRPAASTGVTASDKK
ncbi:MAG: FAD-dependent oxidoreductase [Planctomycetia bacterium]|nr:FAD-dependent oxidoreductase [Planctomycetia bacterium]